jgi:hypothetical protein
MKKALLADRWLRNINVPLLVFLILFLNVKFVIKVIAILFLLVYERNLHLGLSFKRSRLPLFYFLILVVEMVKYLLVIRNYSLNYLLVFGMGLLQWLLCLLAIHHVKLCVDRDPPEKTHNTIRIFYLLNFVVSLCFITVLIVHPVWLTWWGAGSDISFNHPSAGDTILGISFDSSTVNATVNCLGLIYFLYKRDIRFSILCLLVIISCTSNTTFFFMEITLALMVLTVRSKALRIRSIVAAVSMLVLYLVASAHNREYIRNYFVQLYILNKDTSLAAHQDDSVMVRTGKDSLVRAPVAGINENTYKVNKTGLKRAFGNLLAIEEKPPVKERSSQIDSIEKGKLIDSSIYPVISETAYRSKPGKLISFAQTYFFLKMNFRHLLFGSGVGNFSSKLAFRVSGTGVLGTYPKKYQYASPEFRYNHLKTYQFYANMDASRHSVLNFPFSVYNQISGEYGLIGILLFGFGYLWYFVSRFRRLSYGRYMLCALMAFFMMEYWFELFSLVIMFELFLLLNIKEGRQDTANVPPPVTKP